VPLYRLLKPFFDNGAKRYYPAGSTISWDGQPNLGMEPLDDAARAAKRAIQNARLGQIQPEAPNGAWRRTVASGRGAIMSNAAHSDADAQPACKHLPNCFDALWTRST
jgi:hypothetical protein